MIRASAFAPGHISGIFEICEEQDLLKTGSRGCGVVMDKGVYTTVTVEEGGKGISIFAGEEPCACPVTKAVVEEMLTLSGDSYKIEVFHELEVPMKYGFGASASGALGTALALNKALNLNLTMNQCGAVAHKAEVANKTGLGDVIAELNGGLLIRTNPGAPGIGRVDKIPSGESIVAFMVGKELETKSVLLDVEKKKKIISAGRECLDLLFKKPTVENFLRLSKEFALKSGLMDEKVYSAVKTLEEKGVHASMVMLGNAVFTLTSDPEKVAEKLDYMYIISEIDNIGARLL